MQFIVMLNLTQTGNLLSSMPANTWYVSNNNLVIYVGIRREVKKV